MNTSPTFTLSTPPDYPLPPLHLYEAGLLIDACATAFDAHIGGSETLSWEDCKAQQFGCPGCPWTRRGQP